MKKLSLIAILTLVSSSLFAQHSLEKLWESDSLAVRNPESALFDAKSNSLYVSGTGSGTVVRMDLNGKVIQKDWVTGLHSNMGSALYKGMFYTTDPKGIAVIDAEKAAFVKVIPIEGAKMLNDVAVDSKGVIYVSDTRAAKVYRIENEKPTVYLDNILGANGILTVGTDVYILGSTTFLKVNANKEVTKIADGFESGLDGIVIVAPNEFILSNFPGMLWYISADGSKQLLLDTRAKGLMSNDIDYDSKTKTLFVPSFRSNRIVAYRVK